MKISEFEVRRYGPLHLRKKIKLGDFNLIYGLNETGKTLTIEALIRILLGRKIKKFRGIDRVNETPEGYIVIKTKEGDRKIPDHGRLSDITDLTPSECRNIFIIRDSDLSVEEEEFYTEITDRLTGLKSREINSLKEMIRELTKLTHTNRFLNIGEEKLKDRMEGAVLLSEEVELLINKATEENLDPLEEEYIHIKDDIDEKEKLIEEYENARRREQFNKGILSLQVKEDALRKIDELKDYNNEDYQKWRDAERENIQLNKKLSEHRIRIKEKEMQSKDLEEEINELNYEFDLMRKKKSTLDQIHPRLENIKNREIEIQGREEKAKFYRNFVWIFYVLLGISIVGLFLRPAPPVLILTLLFLILTLFSLAYQYRFTSSRAGIKRDFERIRMELSTIGLEGERVEEINKNIEEFYQVYGQREDKHLTKEAEKKSLFDGIRALKNSRQEIEKQIEANTLIIDRIKDMTREVDREGYGERLKEKDEHLKFIRDQENILSTLFGETGWVEKLEELKEFKDKSPDVDYDEKTFRGLKEELDKSKERLKKLDNMMDSFQGELKEVEREANNIFIKGEIICNGTLDLKKLKKQLDDFIRDNNNKRENAITAIEILNAIGEEEREKVEALFGEKSSVSEYFSKITKGFYEKVEFNRDINGIVAYLSDGKRLNAEQLSGGAYDQLYLSVRLALGEELLSGEKGFFILDDPFIKASPDRLKSQMDLLKEVKGYGWQIIYFSAKGEVKEMLEKEIQDGSVKYIELKDRISAKI
ncbi:AAA family ATPase [candidate division WOR-3 bacterium]|nr:AAA family ATPase [candidate division WOR-3 bacterium]